MAKRRNAKKEKASRNKAYARQFRKKPSGFRSRDQRFSQNNSQPDDKEEKNSSSDNVKAIS